MHGLFRLNGAVKRDASIDAWLKQQSATLSEIAREWFTQFRECGDDVLELMHDGHPVACVADLPFGYVDVFKAHVNVGFFFGAELNDKARLLEGSGKRMRHVKLKPGAIINAPALMELIDQSYHIAKAYSEM